MISPEMSVSDILRTASTTSTSKTNKVANKDSYYTCSRHLRMTCAGDKTTIEVYRIIEVLTF